MHYIAIATHKIESKAGLYTSMASWLMTLFGVLQYASISTRIFEGAAGPETTLGPAEK